MVSGAFVANPSSGLVHWGLRHITPAGWMLLGLMVAITGVGPEVEQSRGPGPGLIGTALLQVLQNLVNLLGIPSSLNFAVMGAVILIGVTLDQLLSRRRKV